MENFIKRTMLPFSIHCSVFGFYSLDVKNKIIKYTVIAHCWILTTIHFIIWSVNAALELYNGQFIFRFVVIQCAEFLRMIVILSYSIKCMSTKGIIGEVYNNINFSDYCLERITVKLSHSKNQLLCVTWNSLIVAFWIIVSCNFIQQKATLPFNEHCTLYCILAILTRVHSINLLLAHYTFILYIIKQRIDLFSCSVRKRDLRSQRRIAWSGDATV